ncbi:MAG TPA: alpha/beta hydrolase-fold protein [Puia sp.]|nr:alpha/beta hydrolase-fold protein [Puia sp.]
MRQSAVFGALIILAVCVGACSGTQKDAGYYRASQQLSKDSTDKLKAGIRGISNDLFEPGMYTGSNEIAIRYRLLRPDTTKKKDRYPLVLVLHGSGAVGTDNMAQLGILVKLWAQPGIRERYPAYVVAPQFPRRSSNYSPAPDKKVLVSTPDACLTTALQLIDSLKKVLPVDERKIYVIGFSMGASGAINSLALRPDLFAAAVSISGIPELDRTEVLAHIPLWLVHGNADTENPIPSDSLLFKELQAVKGRKVRFWEVDHLEHDIYYRLYTSEELPEWLFRQRR